MVNFVNWGQYTDCKKFIIFAPEAKSKILDHWADFQSIHEKVRTRVHGEELQKVQERLYRQFEFEDFSVSKKNFIDFVKSIKFDIGPCYVRDNKFDRLSDLEDQIVSEIDDFCKHFNILDSALVIPSWSIALELLETLSKSSECNRESLREICNNFVDCLSRRKLLCDAKFPDGNREHILDNTKKEISKRIVEITNIVL